MTYSIRPITDEDREAVIDIFNHYVEHSFAAFPESRLPYQAFDMFRQMAQGYPSGTMADQNGTVVGFGMLRAYNPMAVFSGTAEWSCFIDHHYTGVGLGKIMLEFLESGGRQMGITNLLAQISSLNEASIRFHRKHGFIECGRFENVGKKNGRLFSTVWMQKILQPLARGPAGCVPVR